MQVSSLPRPVAAAGLTPEQLAHSSALSEEQKIAEASRQFEAILLRQILAETQKTVIPSRFADNSVAGGIYRDMVTSQMADSISQSGTLGLASSFQRQLTHQAHGKTPGAAITPEIQPRAEPARPQPRFADYNPAPRKNSAKP